MVKEGDPPVNTRGSQASPLASGLLDMDGRAAADSRGRGSAAQPGIREILEFRERGRAARDRKAEGVSRSELDHDEHPHALSGTRSYAVRVCRSATIREEKARFDPVEDRHARKGDHVVVDLAWRPLEGDR
jgi:hypothetical protein